MVTDRDGRGLTCDGKVVALVYEDETDIAVSWLLRLRQLQTQGMSFDQAIARANKEFPEG